MINQNLVRCIAAALSFLLFISCKTKQVVTDNSFSQDLPGLKSALASHEAVSPKAGPQFTGREVQLELAVPCFTRYEKMMNAHGFVAKPNGTVTIKVPQEPITTAVSYDGEKMLEWMNRMMKAFPGTDPADIGFLMMPGHLDEDFLKAVQEDPADWKYKLNRTSIFIVPVKKSEGLQVNQMIRKFRSGSMIAALQGRTVWELGGVQP
ncbi:hypothetical protein [Pseudobacter ginsenosidimutans]|nr:hypothetical protein [Pseudobacter ginsenosidimutans]QEC41494.1 hypothetical protein FSB84_07215 [Pseudobacter ginsenosidimutans]